MYIVCTTMYLCPVFEANRVTATIWTCVTYLQNVHVCTHTFITHYSCYCYCDADFLSNNDLASVDQLFKHTTYQLTKPSMTQWC